MKAEEFDRLFDEGSDEIDKVIDWDSAIRPALEVKRVNVDYPFWMVQKLDREARKLGITRQSLIKTFTAQMLQGKG